MPKIKRLKKKQMWLKVYQKVQRSGKGDIRITVEVPYNWYVGRALYQTRLRKI